MDKQQPVIDKLWKNKDGKQAIVEMPNIPLIGWFVFMVVGKFAQTGKLHAASDYLSFGFLFTWAWLELYSGNSYFRRALGLIVLVLITYGKVKQN